jgi:YYY domain-containing protein
MSLDSTASEPEELDEAASKEVNQELALEPALEVPSDDAPQTVQDRFGPSTRSWLIAGGLVLILLLGAIFRFTGVNWDSNQHLHPDERFMTMVAEQISSVDSLGHYFDPQQSSLNPLGQGFYTYGMLPLFITRYVAEWFARTSYDEVVLVGRILSGLFDLVAVLALFFLGRLLYGRRTGLLAAALYAAAVVPIQLSHYFAVDSFTTVFIVAAMYVAILVMEQPRWWLFALFGLLTGLAMTTKVSIAPLAGLILLAGLATLVDIWPEREKRWPAVGRLLAGLLVAGLMAALIFRIFQPYAFLGPGFFGLRLNPRWLEIIGEVRNQVAGRADFPPNHHWANRPWSYSLTNMVQWGMGLPLGLAAILSWGWATWRCLRGDWRKHLLPVVWVGGFFLYQNINFWRYTRYFQPIYPIAILLAAWALVELFDRAWAAYRGSHEDAGEKQRKQVAAILVTLLLLFVVGSTYAYAYAFTRIYARPHARVAASEWLRQNLPGPVNVLIKTGDGQTQIPLSMPYDLNLGVGNMWAQTFTPAESGSLVGVTMPHLVGLDDSASSVTLELALDADGVRIASYTETVALDPAAGPEGQEQSFVFPATDVTGGQEYVLSLQVVDGPPLALSGAAVAMETSWDDSLPLRSEGFDPYGGIYRPLNLELYEPDNQAKRELMVQTLDEAEYIVISSNRVYDAAPRLPLRYPMTVAYYQALFGCESQQITDCAYPAVAPMSGDLGFDLVATFESYPTLGPLTLPDQSAQESFTVYDHPKVLIFQKTADFSSDRVQQVLESVDLSQVVQQGAKQYSDAPGALRLSTTRAAVQKAAGTWSSLFNSASALNQSQFLGTVSWYLLIALIGWLAFPLTYLAFRGLSDHGYALARVAGLLFVAWLAWFSSSLNLLAFSRGALLLAVLSLALLNGLIAWKYRRELAIFLRRHWRYILFFEGLFLVLFLFQIILRWNNPDLWHPWRGGEKPGDLALFNAILKSANFPPYDPWFAGQYVNYYYYGYVLSAVPTKLLGIVPTFAYNLLIPTWFALTGAGVFSVAYNLIAPGKREETETRPASGRMWFSGKAPYLAGVTAVALAIILGNLYQVRLLWNRLPEFAEQRSPEPTWLQQASDAVSGLGQIVSGEEELFRGDNGTWYFNASRAILNGQDTAPITEFPFFTFLYADLHPHLLDMPLVLTALAWIVSIVRLPAIVSQPFRRQGLLASGASWLIAGLTFGALYPTNSWDYPVLLGLGAAGIAYAVLIDDPPSVSTAVLRLLSRIALLLLLSIALYAPFHQWFGTGDLSFELWKGPRTPLGDYFTVHGLFLFVILTYMALETARWLKPRIAWLIHTPLGELTSFLENATIVLLVLIVALVVGLPWLRRNDYVTAAVALLLAAWAGLLLLRRDQSRLQRVALALTGAGLGLTFIVELVTIKGDVGRMNVVFKFYLLTWLFFSVAVGAILVWLWPMIWSSRRRYLWLGALGLLVLAALTYPLIGGAAKAGDRWPDIVDPPKGLDGMAFMLGDAPGGEGSETTVIYRENDIPLRLGQDHAAMRWLQENVTGTPTLVEGHTSEYRWGSRFANYTGLPTIVGWSWHLRQHNAVLPGSVVEKRIEALNSFYDTTDDEEARRFLDRYQADFIIVGDLERARYAPDGLQKFDRLVADGDLAIIYPESGVAGDVTIYAVQRHAAISDG